MADLRDELEPVSPDSSDAGKFVPVPSNAEPKNSGVIPAQSVPDPQMAVALSQSFSEERPHWIVSDSIQGAAQRGFVDEKFSETLRVSVYLREAELKRALLREEQALKQVDDLRKENETLKIASEGLRRDLIAGIQFGPIQQILLGLGGAIFGVGIGIAIMPPSSQSTQAVVPAWLPLLLGAFLMLLGVFARKFSRISK